MKNEALKQLAGKMRSRPALNDHNTGSRTVLQLLSDTFSQKERDKQKMNKKMFSDHDNNITR
jgi:hypothetical protein